MSKSDNIIFLWKHELGQCRVGCVSEAENDTVLPPGDSCPSLSNCSLMCVSGYQRQPDGCYACQCVQPERGQFQRLDVAKYVANICL